MIFFSCLIITKKTNILFVFDIINQVFVLFLVEILFSALLFILLVFCLCHTHNLSISKAHVVRLYSTKQAKERRELVRVRRC
jgi:hypothetical protein